SSSSTPLAGSGAGAVSGWAPGWPYAKPVASSMMSAQRASGLPIEANRDVDFARIGKSLELELGRRLDAVRRRRERPFAALAGENVGERGLVRDRLSGVDGAKLEIGDLHMRVAVVFRDQPDAFGQEPRRPFESMRRGHHRRDEHGNADAQRDLQAREA